MMVSSLRSDQALKIADVALYHQTTMNTQFLLCGIPTAQVGEGFYQDALVKNGLICAATSAERLGNFLSRARWVENPQQEPIKKALGMRDDWRERLVNALIPSDTYRRIL